VGSFYAAEIGPWKYLSSVDPARYNALDALVAWRNFDGIRKDLESQGRWGAYDRHTRVAWEVLRQAGLVNGLSIRGEGREILKERLERISIDLLLEAQRVVPKVFHMGKTFARRPAEYPSVEVEVSGKEKLCRKCGKSGKLNGKHPCGVDQLEERAIPVTAYRVEVPWEAPFEGTLEGLDRLIAVGGFNPDSPEQMKAYARAHKHPLKFDHKKGSESLDKLQLEKLSARHGAKHPIYRIVQDLRGVSKTLGTYVNGFLPDEAGRIYTTYTFGASTGRLTSRAVNLQNVSHRSENEWAEHIRRMIVPREGRVFIEADSAAIEAVFVGYFAGDSEYMERAKLGIHAFLAATELGLPFTPENVREIKGSKDPKVEALYARKKRTVHGVNYGMGPGLMAMQYPKAFPTKRVAQKEIDFYYSVCPKLKAFHDHTQLLAHRQAYLQNPFGYRHYFYDVLKKNPAGEVIYGSDAKRALAFLPQSSAAAFMRESLAQLRQSEWFPEALPANLSIHDALLLEPLEGEAERARDYLVGLMNRPIPEMGGLRVGVDVKIYRDNWQDSEKFGGIA
jgi:DNA polymerase I-like protein with 3'-5' exonuclease and polymerase domains